MKIQQVRPPIDVTNADVHDQLRDVFDGLRVVNKDPTLFSQNGRLVICEIVETDDGEQTRLVSQVDHAYLRTWLITHFAFEKIPPPTRNNPTPMAVATSPSALLLDAMLSVGEWPSVPELKDVSEMPIVTKTGEVVEERGFHPPTRIFLGPMDPLLPEKLMLDPTPEHVARALELLMVEVLGDFEFKEEEDKANVLAAILTAPTRFMYDCPLPLYLFDATNSGSGKGTLAAVVGEMWGGSKLIPAGEDDEEFRKKLLPALSSKQRVIIWDNVEHTLGGPVWNALLTSTEWSDRVLGSSKDVVLPNNKLWVATGNNIKLGRDMARRCVWVMQDPKSDPSKREPSDFRHPDIIDWVRSKQYMLRWAGLTLVMRWVADGMPLSSVTCDNMTPWAQRVGGILENVGVHGFLRDRFKGGAMDVEMIELLDYLEMIAAQLGPGAIFTVKDLASFYDEGSADWHRRAQMLEASPASIRAAASRANGSVSHSIGRYLEKNAGRFAGPSGARLVHAPTSTPRRKTYMVEGTSGVSHVDTPNFTGF